MEFESVADARAKGSWYRREYNTVRPHSSLGYATPEGVQCGLRPKGGEDARFIVDHVIDFQRELPLALDQKTGESRPRFRIVRGLSLPLCRRYRT